MVLSEMSLGSNLFNVGAILGTSGSQDLVNQINARCGGGSFFNTEADPFREGFRLFMNQVVEPIRQVGAAVANVAQKLFRKDEIRPLTCEDDLRWIPPSMHLPIIYFKPIRQMLEEERIEGFGIDPTTLCDEDPYEDLCKSGVVNIHSTWLEKDGSYQLNFYESTVDPDLTPEQIAAIRSSREFLEEFINNSLTEHYDPTNYPAIHS